MHIELTDLLRCPRDHDEAFLVLLPSIVEHRRVVAGHLGCPYCGWSTAWENAVPDFGDGFRSTGTVPFDASAARAMLGIDGPGGWIVLAGSAASLAEPLARELPGVGIVTINPPGTLVPGGAINVLLSGAWPLKAHSVRGAILGDDASQWRDAAVSATLPGLRTVGTGEPPANVDVLAEVEGVWVATHR